MMYSITNKNLVTENWWFYYLEVGVMYANAYMNLYADSMQFLFEPMILKHIAKYLYHIIYDTSFYG